MKQGIYKAVCLVLLMGMTVALLFADNTTIAYESIILEKFDGATDGEPDGHYYYTYHEEQTMAQLPKQGFFTWKLQASKFATSIAALPESSQPKTGTRTIALDQTETFPVTTYVAEGPTVNNTLSFNRGTATAPSGSFGIWGKFDRQGYNWIDLYPTVGEDDASEPVKILIPGHVYYLDLWVWGANLNYTIEAYVEDYRGIVYTIPMGSLAYQGWKNLRVAIPTNIPQDKKTLPRLETLKFLKFRVWTMPTERVDNFYMYISQFKALTDGFVTDYDGDRLENTDFIQGTWNADGATPAANN
jgi:hypothetical protein